MLWMGNILGLEVESERKGERLGMKWDCLILHISNNKQINENKSVRSN